ncbi:hypothetical protein [Methylobacterium komagatae]
MTGSLRPWPTSSTLSTAATSARKRYRFGDGSESAHVADLRTKLAEHRTDRNLVTGRGR